MRIRLILCLTLVGLVLVGGVSACGRSDERPRYTREDRSGETRERRSLRREDPEVASPPPTGLIMINEVTAEELAAYEISKLGPATAEGIVAYREEHGPFRNLADLDKAPRVGPSMLEKLKDRVDFGDAAEEEPVATAPVESATEEAPAAGKININTATAEELMTLPGIGPATAANIIEYRTEKGPFKSIDDIINVRRIGPATLAKFRDQITI